MTSPPSPPNGEQRGSLLVVGTGFQPVGDLTVAAEAAIQGADVVCYLVSNPLMGQWIEKAAPVAVNLHACYEDDQPRIVAYQRMVDTIMGHVRAGKRVCAAFYGHPGVFVYPSQFAIRAARSEGLSARMLPGISAEDYLYADLGLDPGILGCQTYEATDLIIRHRQFDVHSLVIIWQVGVIGNLDFQGRVYYANTGFRLL